MDAFGVRVSCDWSLKLRSAWSFSLRTRWVHQAESHLHLKTVTKTIDLVFFFYFFTKRDNIKSYLVCLWCNSALLFCLSSPFAYISFSVCQMWFILIFLCIHNEWQLLLSSTCYVFFWRNWVREVYTVLCRITLWSDRTENSNTVSSRSAVLLLTLPNRHINQVILTHSCVSLCPIQKELSMVEGEKIYLSAAFEVSRQPERKTGSHSSWFRNCSHMSSCSPSWVFFHNSLHAEKRTNTCFCSNLAFY